MAYTCFHLLKGELTIFSHLNCQAYLDSALYNDNKLVVMKTKNISQVVIE